MGRTALHQSRASGSVSSAKSWTNSWVNTHQPFSLISFTLKSSEIVKCCVKSYGTGQSLMLLSCVAGKACFSLSQSTLELEWQTRTRQTVAALNFSISRDVDAVQNVWHVLWATVSIFYVQRCSFKAFLLMAFSHKCLSLVNHFHFPQTKFVVLQKYLISVWGGVYACGSFAEISYV